MWEGLLGGLGNFASSGLGQATIGAGLGYGVDRLSGGKGGVGALAGGALGGLNALSGGGSMLSDAYSGSIADNAVSGMGGLLGGTKDKLAGSGLSAEQARINDLMLSNEGLTLGGAKQAFAGEQLASQATAPQYNILGNISNFGDKYGDAVKTGTDMFNAYGDYQTGKSEQGYNEAQMNYIQSLQGQQELENLYKRNARASTQSNVDTGFANSSLGSPSNYYTA